VAALAGPTALPAAPGGATGGAPPPALTPLPPRPSPPPGTAFNARWASHQRLDQPQRQLEPSVSFDTAGSPQTGLASLVAALAGRGRKATSFQIGRVE
jgi:hypothetical protein